MKKISKIILLISLTGMVSFNHAFAQKNNKVTYEYTEATDLTIIGKLMPGKTSNPYHRVDTTLYKGFTNTENKLVRMSSGMGCVFRTNSRSISILTDYARPTFPTNTNGISARGYDLYVKTDGGWLYAASGVASDNALDKPFTLISDMDGETKDFLLYFPLYSEENSIKVGVEKGAEIQAIENPFRHRIAIWGSSYTHGSSTTRAGMSYPAQFSRNTGYHLLSLGCSGNCKLQDYFCDVLVDVDADAFVFDAFSNPSAEMIEKRLVKFIDRMIEAHPGKPLVFQQTIYREKRNFNNVSEKNEQMKMDTAERILREIKSTKEGKEKYKDVYFIVPEAVDNTRDDTVDGVHPDNHGYTLWAKSIEKPLVRILKKYGLK